MAKKQVDLFMWAKEADIKTKMESPYFQKMISDSEIKDCEFIAILPSSHPDSIFSIISKSRKKRAH